MDYNEPKFFQGGRRDDSEFALRGVGEHPHRGFETVTIAYQGEVSHRDSHGGGGTIGTGDVQWMTAGSGVMHEEMHSEKFAKEGGLFEMVQLWVNLPAKDKMTTPKYQAIKAENIPVVALPNNAGSVRVIAGESNNTAKLLILTGEPLNEPVVGYGPFVMNSREEILQAIHDVQSGKFGNLT